MTMNVGQRRTGQYCKYKRAQASLLSLGDTVKHSRGAQSRAATPLHQEELAELLGRLVRLPPDASLRRHFRRVHVRADPGADLRLSLLAWEHLGISPEEEDEDRSVWVSRLRVLPPTSRTRISKNKKIYSNLFPVTCTKSPQWHKINAYFQFCRFCCESSCII